MDIESKEFIYHMKYIKDVRMKELFAVIQSSAKNNLLEKFGVALLYNQMIEEVMKNLIIISNRKNNITKTIDFEVTFGKLINIFKKYVIRLENYKKLTRQLEKSRNLRNVLVHNIFEIEYFFDIDEILNSYIKNEEELLDSLKLYWTELE